MTADPFALVQGSDFQMDIWLIDQWTGEPSNRAPLEHDALIWVTEKELSGLQLADPRLPQLLRRALDPSHEPLVAGAVLAPVDQPAGRHVGGWLRRTAVGQTLPRS